MDKKGVVAAAAALVLVVAGGASALSVVSGATTTTESVPTNPEPEVVIEYVDEEGNPVAEPGSPPSTEVRSYTTAGGVTVIESDVAPAVIWVDAPAPSGSAAVQASFNGEDHDDDHEDDDDDDDDEDEDEHEEDDEHEDEHEKDDD
jgi:hypothetical protein